MATCRGRRMDQAFTDPRLCTAIVDRLIFNRTFSESCTDSCRLARTRAMPEAAAI
ncbi:hypothetical protein DWG14_00130 [Streptomyces griseorubiginosus]|uniref:Uncharacterized protein n=1 Tax=Streptomyces griseorubiginosus TaxID=67304 RepID=A0AAI8KU83_9ACTN|nr:hypothetical protein DWG14_00130 [Streptomyces griseorubiginosus]